MEVSVSTGTILCRHTDHPQDLFEIDYDDTASDGRYPGIYPTVNGVTMSGLFFYGDSGLVTPPFTSNATAARVESDLFEIAFSSPQDVLRVRLEGESYRQLNQAAGQEPLFTEAAIYYQSNELHISINGLYYILPTLTDTQITMVTNDETLQKQITPETPAAIEYYPAVTRVDVEDAVFGSFYFKTYCDRLQIQVQDPSKFPGGGFDVFEFDFDHSYKDRGQRSVLTELVIPLQTAQ